MAGLTQKELALKAGVSKDLIYRWENEYNSPSPQKLEKVAEVLVTKCDYLIGNGATSFCKKN